MIESLEMASSYKLVYFNLRALGEPIRLILKYLQVPFDDVRLEATSWMEEREAHKWRQIPELHVTKLGDGRQSCVLTQGTAICRYLANAHPKSDLMPKDPLEAARCDEIADAVQDVRLRLKKYCMAKLFGLGGSTEDLLPNEDKEYVDRFLKNLNELLAECGCGGGKKENEGDFIFGKKVRWADFFLANFTSVWEKILGDKTLLDPYPCLKAQRKAVESLPVIKEWIENRPKTID